MVVRFSHPGQMEDGEILPRETLEVLSGSSEQVSHDERWALTPLMAGALYGNIIFYATDHTVMNIQMNANDAFDYNLAVLSLSILLMTTPKIIITNSSSTDREN